MTTPFRVCAPEVFGATRTLADELIRGDVAGAIARLEQLNGLQAVQLLLATTRRADSVVDEYEIDALADALGVFDGDDNDE